jgi:hypothetical protein
MIAAANEGNECALVNPSDVLKSECFIHPSQPPTRYQTQGLIADEGKVRDLFIRAIVIGDEDGPVQCLELMQQHVSGQGKVGGLAIQEQARA